MRSIDADALIAWIKGSQQMTSKMKCVIAKIETMPDAVSVEWIPCEERLPSNFSEDETVLATTDVDGDRVIQMFAVDIKSFYLKGYVSAWMPLPEPWKGADDE